MKVSIRRFTVAIVAALVMISVNANAQDKAARVSPLVSVDQKLESGANVKITYSQPSVKGRSIGKDLEPINGKIWRTGANEATVFETNKAITVMGNTLPAGKYSLFTIYDGAEVTVIFNKVWQQWGAFKYDQSQDQLRIITKVTQNATFTEKLNFDITDNGKVMITWGKTKALFPLI